MENSYLQVLEDLYRNLTDEQNILKKQTNFASEEEYDKEKDRIYNIGKSLDYLSFLLKENDTLRSSINFQIMDTQEKERQRIARDLHDVTLQNLTYLINKVELSSLYIDKDPVKAKLELETVSRNLKSTISDIRSIIFNLHPISFDDLGFKDSLQNFLSNINNLSGFKVVSNIDEVDCTNDLFFITVFRIIQEACMNAVYHSKGDLLEVNFTVKDSFYKIVVRDNGKGFNPQDILSADDDHHFGIPVMEERVKTLHGNIKINSGPGRGTEVKIEIPFICQGEQI